LGYPVIGVNFGGSADRSGVSKDATMYANKRSEMWGYMRADLPDLAIPDNKDIIADLTGTLYGYVDTKKYSGIMLESKKDMKKRGLASPDRGDALALTYAYPVKPRDNAGGQHQPLLKQRRGNVAQMEYDVTA